MPFPLLGLAGSLISGGGGTAGILGGLGGILSGGGVGKDSQGWDIAGNIAKYKELAAGLKPDEMISGDPRERSSWKITKKTPQQLRDESGGGSGSTRKEEKKFWGLSAMAWTVIGVVVAVGSLLIYLYNRKRKK